MATTNTQVTAYLPEHILEYLTEYCTQYGIIRKKDSKPLLATGIVDLLGIVSTIPIEELTKFTPQTIKEDTLEKKLTDSKVVSKLLDTLLGDKELRQRLQDVLIPDDFLREDKTLLDTLPVSDYEELEVRKDEQNIYVKNLETAIEVSSQEVEEEIEPIAEEVEVILPKLLDNGENEPITEGKEDKKRKPTKIDLVREYIETLPTGEVVLSQSDLVEKAGIAKSKNGKFDTSFLSRDDGKAMLEKYFTKTDKGYIKI